MNDLTDITHLPVDCPMDLALAMVEEDHGRELSLQVARELVMFLKRPGGQSQFSAHSAAQVSERSGVREVQDHVLADLKDDLSVPVLASRAGTRDDDVGSQFRNRREQIRAARRWSMVRDAYTLYLATERWSTPHSHSIVAGGLLDTS